MLELILIFLVSLGCAYVTFELVRWGNVKFPEMNMNEKWWAFVGFLFGFRGMCFIAGYAIAKVLITRMTKR